MFRSVRISRQRERGRAFTLVDQCLGQAERNTVLLCKFFGPGADQHHVFAFFQYCAGQQDRIFDTLDRGDRSGFQRCAIHDDRIELHLAVQVQVRAESGVKRRIVLQNDDGGLHRIDRRAARSQNFPAIFQRATNAGSTDPRPLPQGCPMRHRG